MVEADALELDPKVADILDLELGPEVADILDLEADVEEADALDLDPEETWRPVTALATAVCARATRGGAWSAVEWRSDAAVGCASGVGEETESRDALVALAAHRVRRWGKGEGDRRNKSRVSRKMKLGS